MKLVINIFFFLFSFLFSGGDVTEEIITSIKQSKTTDLVKYFDEKVSIKIITQEDVLSKQQAEANIKYFFEKHSVKGFTNTKTSTVNNTSQYITGNLETTNGKFKVSVLVRRSLIAQFRIETDND